MPERPTPDLPFEPADDAFGVVPIGRDLLTDRFAVRVDRDDRRMSPLAPAPQERHPLTPYATWQENSKIVPSRLTTDRSRSENSFAGGLMHPLLSVM